MTTPQDFQQSVNLEDVSSETGPVHRQNTNAGLDRSSTTTLSGGSCEEENTPLLGTVRPRRCFVKVMSKFRSRNCCLRSSKAALLILVWNLIISFGILGFLDPSWYIALFNDILLLNVYYDYSYAITSWLTTTGVVYGFSALLLLFYPLAGYLADIRWGRYKTVVNSLRVILWSLVLAIVLACVATLSFIPIMILSPDTYPSNTIQTVMLTVVCIVFGLPIFIALVLVLCGLVSFNANVIQYGMDQLHDAPTEDSILYIHWYVWTTFAGLLALRPPVGIWRDYIFFILCPTALILLGITLCLQKYKRNWFMIDSGSKNPYKLVLRIVKFAKDHTNPIRRSAFTYCEDELPSRLDLGKEKYGGPFTTEEVENVKAFLGILGVLLTTGPLFTVDIAVDEMLPIVAAPKYDSLISYIYTSGCITPLIVVVLIPLYLFLLRPFIYDYIPGMLKRMGLGMVLFFISGLCTLVMGVIRYDCIPGPTDDRNEYTGSIINYLKISPNYLLILNILNAFGNMLFYIATFEFICAQSPHSMKGLLIGTYYAIKGVFQLLGVLVIFAPILAWCKSNEKFRVCGFIYYLVNVVILLIGTIAFIIVARKYQYRRRDEPDNIYRYAEEYYANVQDEPNYDYDDYDNLDVETITD